MIEFLTFQRGDVIGVRVSGRIDRDAFTPIASAIEAKLRQHTTVRAYVELADFEGMSAGALLEDLKLASRHWRQVEREAVVTDQAWVRSLSEVADKLVPGIEVRVFALEQAVEARAWIDAPAPPSGP